MTTENSRADALTPCVHADDPKACYRVRCQLGGKCVDDDMSPRQPAAAPIHPDDEAVDRFSIAMKAKLAEARAKGRSGWETCDPTELSIMLREHVEKGDPRDVANFCMFLWALGKPISDAALPMGKRAAPSPADDRAAWDNARDSLAVAPMPPNAQLRRVMDLLDTHLGDSDLMLEGMTQEEIEEEFPVVAAMQIIVGLYQDPPTASDTAPSPADEQRIEAMARAMNVATDGHDRYWTGYVRSATAALRALRKLHPAPSPADERAALQWTAGTLQEIVSGRWTGAKESDKVSIGSVTKTIAQVLDMADAALGRAANQTGAEGAIYQILTEEGAWLDTTREYYERVKSDPALARVVYAAPQPAQADAPASKHAPHDDPFKSSIQGISALLEDMRDDCVARLNVGDADAMVAAAFIMLVRKLVDRAFTESAAQASYDGNHVENHCPECSQYESECECAQADARVGLTDEQIVHAFDLAGVAFPRDRGNVNRLIAAVRGIVATLPGQPEPRAEVTNPFRDLLAALIDIYDDERNNAPEDRCYVEGAWSEVLGEARALLAPLPDPAQVDAESPDWIKNALPPEGA